MRKLSQRVSLALAVLALAAPSSAQTLRIYHIDVDQADSTLFVAPGGNTLLVDSGKNGHGQRIKDVMDCTSSEYSGHSEPISKRQFTVRS